MKKIKRKRWKKKRTVALPKHNRRSTRNNRCCERNPLILWGRSTEWISGDRETMSHSMGEYTEYLCDSINTFYEDSIYEDKDENLYLYIEEDNIWTIYIGTDDAKERIKYCMRIYFPDVIGYHPEYMEISASEEKIREFVDENFNKCLFNQ